ncbi:unnamed protein product [Paramecium sonneborni]|uniref:Uncharacterized protein n=1 Tax=Paramecium sonneborni TaxID=65129 RepID=A0A8S1N5W9_9CILI|nr:unnamed protein product [Paramecium sonneborni]
MLAIPQENQQIFQKPILQFFDFFVKHTKKYFFNDEVKQLNSYISKQKLYFLIIVIKNILYLKQLQLVLISLHINFYQEIQHNQQNNIYVQMVRVRKLHIYIILLLPQLYLLKQSFTIKQHNLHLIMQQEQLLIELLND